MAVPGRKATSLRSSGSAEDYDHTCDACQTGGQHVEAFGYCTDCQDYLCITCYRSHSKNKASRHHTLLDKTTSLPKRVTSLASDTCTEKCSTHANGIVKFFCPKHSDLGCNDCMTLGHRACDIDYIPDKCKGIANAAEYKQIVQDLADMVEKVSLLEKSARVKVVDIVKAHEKAIDDINSFQQEVNERIDHLRKETIKQIDEVKLARDGYIQNVINTCEKITSDVKHVQKSIEDHTKAKLDGQIYISLKRGECLLRSHDMTHAEDLLLDTVTDIAFERNEEIKNILRGFGTLGHQLAKEQAPPVPKKNFNSGTSFRSISPTHFNKPPPRPARVPLAVSKKQVIPPVQQMHGGPAPTQTFDPLDGEEWFHGNIDRITANERLFAVGEDGTFLVRKSVQGGASQPYSLAVLYHGHGYNIKIRKKTDGNIALGEERPCEITFKDVQALINHHMYHYLELINMTEGKAYTTLLKQHAWNRCSKR